MRSRFSGNAAARLTRRGFGTRLPAIVALLAVSIAATAAVYRGTLGYGFDYDDYHFVRPYSRGEVLAAFHGPWDATGIEVPFYRPVTVVFFAARFELLGLNSYAYHTVSLGLTAIAAALAGCFGWALSRRAAGGLAATLVFAVHPALPYSLVAWVTNQMHGLEILVVLSALCWWHAVRRRALVWWSPLLVAGAIAFLIKEDGIMLLPAIVAIHAMAHWIDPDDTPRVPLTFVAIAGALLAALFLARREFLHGLGGYHHATAASAWTNVAKGLVGVFTLRPADRPWQPLASGLATALPVAALVVWRRLTTGTRRLLAAGFCVAVLFDLPFVFVSKAEQMHIVALGAALVLTASVLAMTDALHGRVGLAVLLLALGLASFAAVARDIARDFDPYGPVVRSHDNPVKDWAAVPQELRSYLKEKIQVGAGMPANPADVLPLVAFNLHLPETSPAGVPYRWMGSARTEIDVTPTAREIAIPLRHEIGTFREPAHLTVHVDGRRVDDLTLRDDTWHVSRFAVRPADVPSLRRMHRVEINLDHAWQPGQLNPASRDTRTLGVQIGNVEVR